jgi:hypothetical protein
MEEIRQCLSRVRLVLRINQQVRKLWVLPHGWREILALHSVGLLVDLQRKRKPSYRHAYSAIKLTVAIALPVSRPAEMACRIGLSGDDKPESGLICSECSARLSAGRDLFLHSAFDLA